MDNAAKHPAETIALAAAVATLIVALFGISDPQVYQALVVVVGALPLAVTYVVNLVRRKQAAGG